MYKMKFKPISKLQSLKRSTFPFCRALTVRSPFRSVRAHCSKSAHCALTVRSAATHRSVRFHSFSNETPKWKNGSLRVTAKWEKNPCIKGEGNLIYNVLHIKRIKSVELKVHILELVRFCCFLWLKELNRYVVCFLHHSYKEVI